MSSLIESFYAVTQETNAGPFSLWHVCVEGVRVHMEKVACTGTCAIPRHTRFQSGKYVLITGSCGLQLSYPFAGARLEEQRRVVHPWDPHWLGSTEQICSLCIRQEPDWYERGAWHMQWDSGYNFPWDSGVVGGVETPNVLEKIGPDHPHFVLSLSVTEFSGLFTLDPVDRRIAELMYQLEGDLSLVEEKLASECAAGQPRKNQIEINLTMAEIYSKLKMRSPDFREAYIALVDYGVLFHPVCGLKLNNYTIFHDSLGFSVRNEAGLFLSSYHTGRHEYPKRWRKGTWAALKNLIHWLTVDEANLVAIQAPATDQSFAWTDELGNS